MYPVTIVTLLLMAHAPPSHALRAMTARGAPMRSDFTRATARLGMNGARTWQQRVPNALTVGRALSVPALAAAYYAPATATTRVPAYIFAACCATDALDGYLARRWDASSEFGAFLDPVADKLMVGCVLTLLAGDLGRAVALPAAIIVCREIGVSALREWMATRGQASRVAVGVWGKAKTATQMVALLLLLLARGTASPGALWRTGIALLYLAALLTCSSAIGYVGAAAGWDRG